MNKDILICGVGGQGTVLASKIIAASAMEEGNVVHSAETIGMAQRGGCVTSHIRIGESAFSPLIPPGSADLIFAFEPAEAVRNFRYLKADGTVIVNTVPVIPVTQALCSTGYDGREAVSCLQSRCSCITVNSEEACARFGSSRFFNILILGVSSGSGILGIRKETLLSQIESRVPPKYRDINREAFLAGYEIGESASPRQQ